MKRLFKPICALALTVGIATAVAQAQPDPNVQPKADNPVNRPVGGGRGGGGNDIMRQRMEGLIRGRLTAAGFADKDLQDAVIAHMTAQNEARQPINQKAMAINQALRNDATTDAQLSALLNDYQAAVEDFEANRDKSDQALDDKLGYSKNIRLHAALTVLGAIGHMPSPFMQTMGGMGGRNGMRPRRPRNNDAGGANGAQPNPPGGGAPPVGGAPPAN